jgi:transposase-like protein
LKRAYPDRKSARKRETTGHHTGRPQAGRQIQLTLDRDELLAILQDSLEGLAVELGLLVASALLEDEVTRLCGRRYERQPERRHTRYGHQRGVATLAGQKLPIERPRVRRADGGGEVALQTYALLQSGDAMPRAVLRRMVRGVSPRDYEGVIDAARDGFGVAKSSVSRGFVRASAADLKALAERRFDGERFAVVMIDGVEYAGETMVVAPGITEDGTKRVLGLRQGATENAAVCAALLEDLVGRGLDASRPTLFVLDGSKALHAAVTRVWGQNAAIQRCQVHKMRNLKAHVPEKQWPELLRRLSEAYHETHYATAKSSLEGTARWLDQVNPDAASSLREGLEETLTVVRLGVPGALRRTLATTNPIESALSVTRRVTARVTRWRDGDMRRRWCAAGLLRAEAKFRRVKGHRAIPALLKALEAVVRGDRLESGMPLRENAWRNHTSARRAETPPCQRERR